MNDWLSTKKRGRDDEQIEQDRRNAVQARRKKKTVLPAVEKPARPSIPTRKDRSRDNDSLDGFIVNTDEDENEKNVDNDSSSDEDIDTFLKLHNKYASRPVSKPASIRRPITTKPRPAKVSMLELDDSDDSGLSGSIFSKKASSGHGRSKIKCVESLGNNRILSNSLTNSDRGEKQTKASAGFAKDTAASRASYSTDVSFVGSSKAGRNTHVSSNSTPDDDGCCLIDSPTPDKRRSRTARKKDLGRKYNQIDVPSDEDEALALALAISESSTKSEIGRTIDRNETNIDRSETEVVDLLQVSSHDEDEQEEYMDPSAKEATIVLEKANALSAQILRTLQEWSKTTDTTPTIGMLEHDGAISLSSTRECHDTHDHKWISRETMEKIVPNVVLAEYQLIGVNWMALLDGLKCEVQGLKKQANVNGILADEMGLGKTVQTIAFLSLLKHTRNRCLPHLVIAPSSVLSNWEREFDNFAPHLKVIKYHGSMVEREALQEKLRVHFPKKSGKNTTTNPPDVILAPITYFQKEKSDDRAFLKKFQYDYLVVDEAHVLKNSRGTRYKSLDKFSTEHRLLLTGTPVQNTPKELLALLCFLMPLFRKSNSFDDDDGHDGGESMLQHFISVKVDPGSSEEDAYRKLKQLFAPFVLRRRKQDVLDQVMPPKHQSVEFIDLDPVARQIYDSLLSNHVNAQTLGEEASRDHLFTCLRKASHHPLLLRTRFLSQSEKQHLAESFFKYGAFSGEGCTKAKVAEELENYSDFQIHLTALELIEENHRRGEDLQRYTLKEEDLFTSAKFARLSKLLPNLIRAGHRVLIFSVWTSCLDLLSCLMEHLSIDFLRMEGSTPVEDRQDLIDNFNRNPSIPVFLLSTKACGLGINLTSADTCIFHDLDFNPMNDIQAEDRCHRIGQTNPVTVIRLVAKNTVDEDIYEMQQRKSKMSAAIMATNGSNHDWNKQSVKEKNLMLQTAIDRFKKKPSSAVKAQLNVEGVECDEV